MLLSPQTLCVRACAKQLHLFKASDLELENASLLTDYCEKQVYSVFTAGSLWHVCDKFRDRREAAQVET